MKKTLVQADFVSAVGVRWAGDWQADVAHGLGTRHPLVTLWVEYEPSDDGGLDFPGAVVGGPLGQPHIVSVDANTLRLYRSAEDAANYPGAKFHVRVGV
jgi:hypothetical protein